jgi:hypothetical protein
MIATYPDLVFQVWEYRVTHGSLLIRSPKRANQLVNVDIIFSGVEWLSVSRLLKGLIVEVGNDEDVARASFTARGLSSERVFALLSGGQRHLVVAAACRVSESDMDIFSSPFAD